MARKGTPNGQFRKRIPLDLKDRLVGRTLIIPFDGQTVTLTVTAKAECILFSLKTADRATISRRHAEALAYVEGHPQCRHRTADNHWLARRL